MTLSRDAAVATGLIAAAIAAIAGVWHLQGWASLYPMIMAGALLIGGLLLLGISVAGRRTNVEERTEPDRGGLLPVAMATVALVVAMPWIGFYPATFLYLAGLFVWRSTLRPAVAIVVAAVLTAAIYMVFGFLLAVPTPDGISASFFQG